VQKNSGKYRKQVQKRAELIGKLYRHFSMGRARRKSKKLNLLALLKILSKRRGGMKR
jgi:hypothetical protein